MQTGENEQALRKILDMTRLMGVFLLCLHFYYYCFSAFEAWKLTTGFTNRLLHNIHETGLFDQFGTSKLMALGILVISLIGARGKKKEKLRLKNAMAHIVPGLLLYF